MKRLIDAEELWDALNGVGGTGAAPDTWADGYDKGISVALELVNESPTIDADQVVRCRECKWGHKPYTDGLEMIFPGITLSCRMRRGLNEDPSGELWTNGDSLVSGEDFCSHGERKEGDGNEVD